MESIKQDQYDSIRLRNQICFPLYACAKEVVRRYREPLEALNLTYTQYLVMMVLWEHGGMTEGELGRKVYLDSGTLAPLLKRMEKQGYITRIRPETNERKLIVELTAAGHALKDQATQVPGEMEGCLNLTRDEQQQLKKLLDKAIIRMEV